MCKLYSLHRIDDSDNDMWVGDVWVDHHIASTRTYMTHRLAAWDDLEDIFLWACGIHNVDPYCAYMVDPSDPDDTPIYF